MNASLLASLLSFPLLCFSLLQVQVQCERDLGREGKTTRKGSNFLLLINIISHFLRTERKRKGSSLCLDATETNGSKNQEGDRNSSAATIAFSFFLSFFTFSREFFLITFVFLVIYFRNKQACQRVVVWIWPKRRYLHRGPHIFF